MEARVVRLPVTTGFWPLSRIARRVSREFRLWLWRRERSQRGAPVTGRRRKAGRAYMFESRRPEARPGL